MSFVCLLLSSPLRLSFVSVVFDFNDSLNEVAPLSSMLLSVDEMVFKMLRKTLLRTKYMIVIHSADMPK